MGLFNFLEDVVEAAVHTVILPIEIVKDVVTLDGSNTERRVSKVLDKLEDAADDIVD